MLAFTDTTIGQAMTKVHEVSSGFVYLPAVFDWATRKKRNFEVFLNFIYYNHSLDLAPKEMRNKEKPISALNKYRRAKNLPNTK